MSKGLITIGLLVLSNIFMTLAWYGHLKFGEMKGFQKLGLLAIIFISWGPDWISTIWRSVFASAIESNSRGDHIGGLCQFYLISF